MAVAVAQAASGYSHGSGPSPRVRLQRTRTYRTTAANRALSANTSSATACSQKTREIPSATALATAAQGSRVHARTAAARTPHAAANSAFSTFSAWAGSPTGTACVSRFPSSASNGNPGG